MNWEVRTMRSVKSWFNPTLFWKNFARFWPIWGIYLAILALAGPAGFLLTGGEDAEYIARVGVLEFISPAGLWLGMVFSVLAATAVYSYLCSSRSVGLMHSLPIRREGLFLTSYLSGLGFMVGPNLAALVLMLLAEAARGEVCFGALVMCFFAVSLMELFFFSLATLCAMCTGHNLGIPGLYIVANCLVISLYALVNSVLSQLIYGYVYNDGLSRLVTWLTPVAKLMSALEVTVEYSENGTLLSAKFLTLGYILIYVLVGLVMTGLALILYRRRQMERAGDVITVSWMRPVFRYVVALFFALGLGQFLYYIFEAAFAGTLPLLLFMLVCGAAGYFVAEMVLQKSFWVFRRWKGCLALLGVLTLVTVAVDMDWIGVESRVPDEGNVASVEIGPFYDSYPYYDSASWSTVSSGNGPVIQAVLALHQTIVDERGELEQQADSFWTDYWEAYWNGESWETANLVTFDVTYNLKSGGVVKRSYELPVLSADFEDDNSVSAQLSDLLAMPQVVQAAYGLENYSFDQLVYVDLYSDWSGEVVTYIDEDGEEWYDDSASVAVDSDIWPALYRAIQEDLADGSLGRMYVMQTEEAVNTCYDVYIDLTFQVEQQNSDGKIVTYTDVVTITLQTTAQRTMAVLEGLGIFDDHITLRTYAQVWE